MWRKNDDSRSPAVSGRPAARVCQRRACRAAIRVCPAGSRVGWPASPVSLRSRRGEPHHHRRRRRGQLRPRERPARQRSEPLSALTFAGAGARDGRRSHRIRPRQQPGGRQRPRRLRGTLHSRRDLPGASRRSRGCPRIRPPSCPSASAPRPLRPVFHMAGFIGDRVPVFEIRRTAGADRHAHQRRRSRTRARKPSA